MNKNRLYKYVYGRHCKKCVQNREHVVTEYIDIFKRMVDYLVVDGDSKFSFLCHKHDTQLLFKTSHWNNIYFDAKRTILDDYTDIIVVTFKNKEVIRSQLLAILL